MNLLEDVLDSLNEPSGFVNSQSEHVTSLLGLLQGVVQYPWDPMVEIPTPPEMGCGQLRYVCLFCICDEHKEDSHPRCLGACYFTYVVCA
jgi:hypothetical protein